MSLPIEHALARLSIERIPLGGEPRQPLTNDQRIRAFRPYMPVRYENDLRLPASRFATPRSAHERYAAEACADAEISTDDQEAA